jgi:hypothetical protein
MATTVTIDADDLAYLAELAAKHLTRLGWLAGDNAALDPIFGVFLTLEEHAPTRSPTSTTCGPWPWRRVVTEHDEAAALVVAALVGLAGFDWDDQDVTDSPQEFGVDLPQTEMCRLLDT